MNLEEDAGDNVDPDTGEVVGDDTPDCATPEAVLESGLCAGSASPGASASSSASPSAVEGVPQDCDNFASQAGAQDFLNDDPSDPAGLDADDDGIACEDSTGGGSTATPTATATASASASASASVLPETGGVVSPAALSVVAALLLVGGGIMSASIARRG